MKKKKKKGLILSPSDISALEYRVKLGLTLVATSAEHAICNPHNIFGQVSVFKKISLWTAPVDVPTEWKNIQNNA